MVNVKKKVVVAMSGGVDSSVVAAMMHELGHQVIGITLQLYDQNTIQNKKGSCCAGQDIYDAKMVANKIGIPHYVLNYESIFHQSVIDDFVDNYLQGRTPIPCIKCNQSVKFNDLLKVAKDLKADVLATGHYVQKITNKICVELHQAVDVKKDQSYFLFATTYDQLNWLQFPLGSLTKQQTRALAIKYQLDVAEKVDSQDICFVPEGDYRKFVKKMAPNAIKQGSVMHVSGFKLGYHNGIMNYTIGQRRGLGFSYSTPLYVIKIDPIKNIVYLGPESKLFKKQFLLKDVNWLAHDINPNNVEVIARIRSTSDGVLARVSKNNDNTLLVSLYVKEKAITPGQACVLYLGTRVLGGGWIDTDINNF